MKRPLTLAAAMLAGIIAATAQPAQTFRNPVLPGMHPDPSVCRVGEDFYLVNSTFQYFPGVPIYHSRDLVNWGQLGNVLDRKSQLPLSDASSWLGIYAPTIRYDAGTYYMITTNVGNGGNFMVTATNPGGPWSEPIWLEQQGIDPSLYFENGRCYMVSNPDGNITLCEIDAKTGRQLTPSRTIWTGTGGRYPEGPHLYKKDGFYYLLISEGGTELAHHLTIARSRKMEGPYVSNPANPILTNCNHLGESKQIQGCGHGDFVQDARGNWWVVFLAYRNFGGSYHHLGRETCLAPVEWKRGEWPVVYDGQAIDTVMTAPTLNLKPMASTNATGFGHGKFGAEWLHLGQPVDSCYRIDGNRLRLWASPTSLDDREPNTFVGRRQTSPKMSEEVTVDASGLAEGSRAGLTVFQINDGHYDLFLTRDSAGTVARLRCRLKSVDYIVGSARLVTHVGRLKISSDGLAYHFFAAGEGGEWQRLGSLDTSLVSSEVAGGFTGVTLGLFCTGRKGGYAAFCGYMLDSL